MTKIKSILFISCLFMLFLVLGVDLMAQPYGLGQLIVLNKSHHSVSFIDLQTAQEKFFIEVGEGPHEVAVSANQKWAVVTNYGPSNQAGNSLSVIDIANRKVAKTISLNEFKRPHGILFINEDEVLVTVESNKSLLKVNITTGEILQSIGTDQSISHMVEYDETKDLAFVANIGSGTLTVIDVGQSKKIKDIVTGKGAEGLAIQPSGKEVWVSNRDDNSISIIDTKKLEVIETIKTGAFPIRIKFTSDGKLALVSNAKEGTVAVYDAATRFLIKSINIQESAVQDNDGRIAATFGDGPIPIGILIHPSNKFAYIANTNADTITVLNLENMMVVGRIQTRQEPDGLGFVD